MTMSMSTGRAFIARATRHQEIGVEIGRAGGFMRLRNGANHESRIEQVIIEREVVRGQDIDAQFLLPQPVLRPQTGGGLQQAGLVGLA